MAKSKQGNSYAYAFTAIAVLALAAILYIVLGASFAETSTQQATVSNSTPTVDSVNISTTALGSHSGVNWDLTSGGFTDVYINGVASDANGCGEIDAAADYTIVFYETSAGSSCTADGANCYIGDSADITVSGCTGGSDTTAAFSLALTGSDGLAFFAQSGGWTASVVAHDGTISSSAGLNTTTINSLTGFGVTSSIDYGSLALNATSEQQTIVVTNLGNSVVDVNLAGEDLACTVGTIPVANLVYNTTSGAGHGSGTSLTTGGADLLSFDLAARAPADGTDSTKDIYTYLELPAVGISGTCSGDMTITTP